MVNAQVAKLSSFDDNHSFCIGLVLTRRDGAVIGLTSLDESFTYTHTVRIYNSDVIPVETEVSVNYLASTGFSPSNYNADVNMTPGDADITGLFTSAGLDLNDVKNGLYDRCGVDVYIFEHTPKPVLKKHLARGWWGRVALQKGRYYAQFQSLVSLFNNQVTRRYSFNCDASVGDNRCRTLIHSHIVKKVKIVDTSIDPKEIIISATALDHLKEIGNVAEPPFDVMDSKLDDVYAIRYGIITFTSGSNVNMVYNSRSHTVEDDKMIIVLYDDLIRQVAVDDEFTFIRGCRRTIAACGKVFGNTANFRGFPYIPPKDHVVGTYVATGVNNTEEV